MAKKAPVQATLSFDESESGSAFSFISPVKDPNPLPPKEPSVITVSELGERIRDVLDCELLTGITVTGEVTGYRPNSSGHLYFSLTEKGKVLCSSQLNVDSYRRAERIKQYMHDNPEVIYRGMHTLFTGNVDFIFK